MPRASLSRAVGATPEPVMTSPPVPMKHHHITMGLLVVLGVLSSGVVSLSAFAAQGSRTADNIIVQRLSDRLAVIEKKVESACGVPLSPLDAMNARRNAASVTNLGSLEDRLVKLLKKVDTYCGKKPQAATTGGSAAPNIASGASGTGTGSGAGTSAVCPAGTLANTAITIGPVSPDATTIVIPRTSQTPFPDIELANYLVTNTTNSSRSENLNKLSIKVSGNYEDAYGVGPKKFRLKMVRLAANGTQTPLQENIMGSLQSGSCSKSNATAPDQTCRDENGKIPTDMTVTKDSTVEFSGTPALIAQGESVKFTVTADVNSMRNPTSRNILVNFNGIEGEASPVTDTCPASDLGSTVIPNTFVIKLHRAAS